MAGQCWGKKSDSYGTVEGSSWIGHPIKWNIIDVS